MASHNDVSLQEITAMFGNAGETEFDLRFRLFGIPTRVHPLFWVMAAFIAWSPNNPQQTMVGMLCLFLSVLVHELGHAVVYRWYGFPGEIVLYLLGGYATGRHLSTWRSIFVSAAGPGAGFLLAILTFAAAVGVSVASPGFLDEHYVLEWAVHDLLFFNIWLGILNLVPTLPLDGGNIMAALVFRYWPRRAEHKVLWISIIASGAVALWGVQMQARFLMIMFGIICAQHVMTLNQYNRYR